MSAIVGTSISDELNNSLSRLTVQLERSKRYIIQKAIERFVAEELEDDFDIALGNEALKIEAESDGEYITLEKAFELAHGVTHV